MTLDIPRGGQSSHLGPLVYPGRDGRSDHGRQPSPFRQSLKLGPDLGESLPHVPPQPVEWGEEETPIRGEDDVHGHTPRQRGWIDQGEW